MSGRAIAAANACVFAIAVFLAGCSGAGPTQPTSPVESAGAGPGTVTAVALRSAPENTRVHAPIAFTLRGCPNLPEGLTVSGTGDEFLVINTRVDQDGVTHRERNDLVTGTAADSDGASYKFNYHNHSNITMEPGGFPWSFTTTDHFNLVGNGMANQLTVSFVARVTFPAPDAPPIIEFVNDRGDPFFCDPI